MSQEAPKTNVDEGEAKAKLAAITVTVRCYAELNDFLSADRQQTAFEQTCHAGTTVKDLLEGIGIPHTEVDLALVNGEPSAFDRRLAAGDRVTAYPVFEALDITDTTRVRPAPLREIRFVVDTHLGRLARLLRLAGFDTLYANDARDESLAEVSAAERRILLTRDHGLLKRRLVTHGTFVRSTAPGAQLAEVVGRFHLERLARPFTRCTRCNGALEPVNKADVAARVPRRAFERHEQFLQCPSCGRVYWEGTHYARLRQVLEAALGTGFRTFGPHGSPTG